MSQPDYTRESVYLGISPTGNLIYLSRKKGQRINYDTYKLFIGRRIGSNNYRGNILDILVDNIDGFGGNLIIPTKAGHVLDMTEKPVIWRFEQLHNLHIPNYLITEYKDYAIITESSPD